jgi:uncharacterized protein with PIN domain
MNQAWFRFYEELNDFLPAGKRKQQFLYEFNNNPSVKDLIEAIGIPHVEVDMVLINGNSVDFSCKVKDKDIVSVYPVFESLDISPVTHLRERPLRNLKFILDVHLGKLAKYLRLLGFDIYIDKAFNDNDIVKLSKSERRVILTRDKGLLKNKIVTHGYWIRSQKPVEQLNEVIIRFDLRKSIHLYTRCLKCNGLIEDVSKEEISGHLLPKTRKYYHKFKRCTDCKNIYWEGSHFLRMKNFIENITGNIK